MRRSSSDETRCSRAGASCAILSGLSRDESLMETDPPPHVALMVTCLVDMMRPSIGFASVKLLEAAGCRVSVPRQTCCGQPNLNGGDRDGAKQLARQMIEALEGHDHVVVPSGSCAGTLIQDYPRMFEGDAAWQGRARALAARTHEITAFLVDVMGFDGMATHLPAHLPARATYHDSCSSLRTLGIASQPRQLLEAFEGLELAELREPEVCCGFGGTFCVKYPEISNRMVSDKAADIVATGAEIVLGGDLGCLLNIAGRLAREGQPIRARHIVEVLAGQAETPPIGGKK